MKYFTPELLRRNIVMISDYVDPSSYSGKHFGNEQIFIETLKDEVSKYHKNFHYVEVKDLPDLENTLNKHNINDTVIFNWCEYLEEREATAPVVTKTLEDRGFIFTGSDTRCLMVTSSKEATKKVLLNSSVPTPNYTVITSSNLYEVHPEYPLILKLEDRHSSAGMTNENVVYNRDQLMKVCKRMFAEYSAGIIAEEFLDGQEYTATVWGNGSEASCIYITTESYNDRNVSVINTESGKFSDGSADENNLISIPLDKNTDKTSFDNICNISINAYSALGFSDYGRFELREKNGQLFVIDCNPNPWIGLGAVLFKGTKIHDYNFGETLLQICEFAVKRYMK